MLGSNISVVTLLVAALAAFEGVVAGPVAPRGDFNPQKAGYKCRCIWGNNRERALKKNYIMTSLETQLTMNCCGDPIGQVFSPYPQKNPLKSIAAGDGFCYRLGSKPADTLDVAQYHKCCSTAVARDTKTKKDVPYFEMCQIEPEKKGDEKDKKAIIDGKVYAKAPVNDLASKIVYYKDEVELINSGKGSAPIIEWEKEPVFWKNWKKPTN